VARARRKTGVRKTASLLRHLLLESHLRNPDNFVLDAIRGGKDEIY
jgi:hypothetical protein